MISAFRINHFYESTGFKLAKIYNLMLYYVGMFYNLFLPGAIGGDGYKIYLLKQQNGNLNTKSLVSATLLDRLSGLLLLFFLACIFLLFSSYQPTFSFFRTSILIILIIMFPIAFLIASWIFPLFKDKFLVTSFLSLGVQLMQVICAIFILISLGIQGNYVDYLTLFLISSVVAVLPITIGGVGARELVFLYGYNFLNIEKPIAIAFTLLFFFITAISSLAGIVFSYQIDKKTSFRNLPK